MSECGPAFLANIGEVREHARREHPREACGLLARPRPAGEISYFPCRNDASPDAAPESFRINPRDWADVEDHAEIVAVVHSHPDGDAHASDADKAMCHRSGLPWFIVAEPGGAWSCIWPEPLPLVGRVFFHGLVDCYSLIQDHFWQVLKTELPHFDRSDGWWERGENLYRKNFAAAGFVDLGRPAGRADGSVEIRLHDVLLMQVAAREENHAAVFVGRYNDVDCILHHLYGRLSGHDPWCRDWIERCTAVLRHRSLL